MTPAPGARADRKLVLVMIDSLKADGLQRAVEIGAAPTLARLIEHGELIPDCVSTFPSVTPVACAEMVTGERAAVHGIPGMNWYHRAEHRYVEYGSSWEATRAFGLFRTLYDTVYNMNLAHLSPRVRTLFERLGAAGLRTACTPFLIYRGPRRHELGLEGLLRRAATAAKFHHAVWGPDELFYGELYASRRTPCKPTLGRPGTRDAYTACVSRELVEADAYDFLLFSLPDNDFHTHNGGPAAMPNALRGADAALKSLIDAVGGFDAFLATHAVIVIGDHAQTEVKVELPLATALAEDWRVLAAVPEQVPDPQLAVTPTARAAGVYVIDDGVSRRATHATVAAQTEAIEGVELTARLLEADGEPTRPGASRRGTEAVVRAGGAELRFAPGSQSPDLREGRWDIDGDRSVLGLTERDGRIVSERFPDALGRLWSALSGPHSPDIVVSATEGHEFVDWGGATHVPGGSHGGLGAGDSLSALITVGVDSRLEREQWAIRDATHLVLDHFGLAEEQGAAA